MLVEKFQMVPQDIKDAIAKADPSALKLLIVNSPTFKEIDEARKFLR